MTGGGAVVPGTPRDECRCVRSDPFRARGRARDARERRAGRALSDAADQAVGVVPSGWRLRSHRELAARAAPDGYALLLAPSSLLAVNPHLYAKMAIDPLKELLPVASLVVNELILAVNPALAVKDFQDFVALARAARPPLFYASIGNGSEHHLAMELLKQQAGVDLVHVPYRGGGPAAIGVMAGDIAAMFGGGSVAPLIQSGKLRGLAVTGQRRSHLLPDLPPIAEFYPGYEVTIWQGLFAPIGTPPEIVRRLREDMGAVLAQGDIAEKLAAAGSGEPYVTTVPDFLARIRSDHARYGKLIKDAGLAVD